MFCDFRGGGNLEFLILGLLNVLGKSKNILPNGGLMVMNPMVKSVKTTTKQIQAY